MSPKSGPDDGASPLVSVIVPCLDEEAALPDLLAALRLLDEREGPAEVLVVDGGSRDGTRAIARAAGEAVRLVESARGRAGQMNAGAREARGPLLWFLHADCRPLPGSLAAIRRVLARPRVALGYFDFRLDGPRPLYRLYELGVWWRVLLFRNPYGDQGLFVRREDFAAVGGYQEVPLFEDVYLVRSLRRRGRLRGARRALPTSPRRWEQVGLWRTTRQHLELALREKLGASPAELAARRRGASEEELRALRGGSSGGKSP